MASMGEVVVGSEHLGVMVHAVHMIETENGGTCRLVISNGSVLEFVGDAIVNAAKEACLDDDGGIDGEITKAGGEALSQARRELPELPDPRGAKFGIIRCPTGDARITIGGKLKVPWCIHAVGPNYTMAYRFKKKTVEECDELVKGAYRNALACAREKSLRTVAFSLISSSIFRGERSLDTVLDLGVEGVLAGAYSGLEEVHLVGYSDEELHSLLSVCESRFNTSAAKPEAEALTPPPSSQSSPNDQ